MITINTATGKMTLADHVKDWKKEDFNKAFGNVTKKDAKGKDYKLYNADEIYKAVQEAKKNK